ncbi:MAG: exosome complex RNA-binding protein Csl4 [Infirmifilum sp.]
MSNIEVKDSDVKVPGDVLGVEEEYLPGGGVFVEQGYLKAKVLGRPYVDPIHHILEVKAVKATVLPLSPRDVVYASVEFIRDPVVHVKIFYVENKNVVLGQPVSGVLTSSNISTSRVKNLYEVVGYGDVLRAYVAEPGGPPYLLAIKGRDFGVILARCPKCLSPMRLRGLRLVCPACGSKSKRKISSRYLLRR